MCLSLKNQSERRGKIFYFLSISHFTSQPHFPNRKLDFYLNPQNLKVLSLFSIKFPSILKAGLCEKTNFVSCIHFFNASFAYFFLIGRYFLFYSFSKRSFLSSFTKNTRQTLAVCKNLGSRRLSAPVERYV